MIGKLLSISAGIGGRAAFGLVFAVTVIRHLPSEASAAFFQIVLLQSVFINLIGGGGYVRGAAQSASVAGSVRLLRGFFASAGLGLGGALLLASTLGIPAGLAPWQLMLLVAAGLFTALNAHLMGILSGIRGVRRVFLPLSLLFALLSLLLLVLPPRGFEAAIIVAAISQSAPLGLLLMMNREARGLLQRVFGCHRQKNSEAWWPFGNLVVGGAAAAYLLIFYWFREIWSASVTFETAAAAFFAYRMSETYIQVFSVAAASMRGLTSKLEQAMARNRARLLAAIGACAILAVVQLATISHLVGYVDLRASLLIFLTMQLACETLRFGTAMVSVIELTSGRTLRFFALAVVPAAIAATVGGSTSAMSGPGGLFVFQTVFAALQVTGWLVLTGIAWRKHALFSGC